MYSPVVEKKLKIKVNDSICCENIGLIINRCSLTPGDVPNVESMWSKSVEIFGLD